jgi:ATP-dependent Clp protease ATP-binding subunit ClpC
VEVTEEEVARVVSSMTGIPITKIAQTESEKLMNMENELKKKIVGQDDVVSKLTKAIRRARAGLKDPRRPIGSFIFLGPTGVGKTELAKVLAEYLFGDQDALIRIDMSEYMEKFSVSRLIGAPPGYVGYEEGGELTEKVRRRPYSVVLLDEIEKAHYDVFNLLLQVFDDGSLTDSFGRRVDFRNTILIMTSNIGARKLKGRSFGFAADSAISRYEAIKAKVMEEVKRIFNPEFLNRIDEIIVFRSLEKKDILKIIDISMEEVREKVKDRGINIELTQSAREYIAEKGYDIDFGARPLKRAIQANIEDPIAEKIINGEFPDGSNILVSYKDNQLKFVQAGRSPGKISGVRVGKEDDGNGSGNTPD